MDITEAKKLFDQNELNKALEMLDLLILEDTSDFYSLLLRGRIYYKMQKWGDAMNDYSAVLEINPENHEAKSGIVMARSILGYFTPDMFNP
ncbi:MAG: tetratricopeptide repeat protein [Bacteroidia bacterium]